MHMLHIGTTKMKTQPIRPHNSVSNFKSFYRLLQKNHLLSLANKTSDNDVKTRAMGQMLLSAHSMQHTKTLSYVANVGRVRTCVSCFHFAFSKVSGAHACYALIAKANWERKRRSCMRIEREFIIRGKLIHWK